VGDGGSDSRWRARGTLEDGEPPIFAVHEVLMVWQKGRKGFFWSCH